MASRPVLTLRTHLEDARRCFPHFQLAPRIRSYLGVNTAALADMGAALRAAVDDEQLAARFRADPEVWSALTALSKSIVPLTELYSVTLENVGPLTKWLAIHADLESRCFRIYEKMNDCKAETGGETCVAHRDSFDAAVGEINDRALIASLDEPAVGFASGMR